MTEDAKTAGYEFLAGELVKRDAEIERLLALVREAANEIDELGFPSVAETFLRALEPKP